MSKPEYAAAGAGAGAAPGLVLVTEVCAVFAFGILFNEGGRSIGLAAVAVKLSATGGPGKIHTGDCAGFGDNQISVSVRLSQFGEQKKRQHGSTTSL